MISFNSVNWLAVAFGTVLSMALGALWYGPLFGNLWLKLIEKSMDELEANPMNYVKSALAAFISMLVLNLVVVSFGAQTLVDGLMAGAVAFIGLGATATFVYTTFEGPKESVWLLYALYQLLVFIIMGGVFAMW